MILNLSNFRLDGLATYARYTIYISIIVLTIAGLFHYEGSLYVYILFSIVSNALLYFGFRKNAIFFDTFIGIFFWLGFWLKLTVRIVFVKGVFHVPVGDFDGSGASFDRALLVSTCGLLALILASFVREKLIFNYPRVSCECKQNGVLYFYQSYRKYIFAFFTLLILTVALSNIYFGIYQRGEITRTSLPYGLNGVYKWLLLFGLASLSAVILHCELILRKEVSFWTLILSLFESFSSSVSMLSRGMVLNTAALIYGLYLSLKINSAKLSMRNFIVSFLFFIVLFISSVFIVNYLRVVGVGGSMDSAINEKLNVVSNNVDTLFVDRWVGIEGVMSVTSSEKLGWKFWQDAWKEKYSETSMSFYDKNLITSPYSNTDFNKYHHLSLPGVVAFFFYPGSFLFLFICMFLLGIFASFVEISAFKLCGNNLILCALMGQVVAYRFLSFGYVPAQSYLLFGTIFANLFIIYYANKFLVVWGESKSNKIAS